jgi:hypothetical protein
LAEQSVGGAHAVLAGKTFVALAAGNSRLQQDARAYFYVGDFVADLGDFAGYVAAGDVRQGDFQIWQRWLSWALLIWAHAHN